MLSGESLGTCTLLEETGLLSYHCLDAVSNASRNRWAIQELQDLRRLAIVFLAPRRSGWLAQNGDFERCQFDARQIARQP